MVVVVPDASAAGPVLPAASATAPAARRGITVPSVPIMPFSVTV